MIINYSTSCLVSLYIHLIWTSLDFLDLNVCFLLQVRNVFSYHFFKEVFFLSLSLLLLEFLQCAYCSSWYRPINPLNYFHYFWFFLFVWLGKFHCSIFKFIDCCFWLVKSVIEPLYWIFQFSYCISLLCDLFGAFLYFVFLC